MTKIKQTVDRILAEHDLSQEDCEVLSAIGENHQAVYNCTLAPSFLEMAITGKNSNKVAS